MGWAPLIHTRFLVSRTTLDTTSLTSLILQDSHLLWFAFPDNSFSISQQIMQSEPQRCKQHWFGLFLFRSPLLQESSFLSFPAGTKMFQFPAFPSYTLLYLCMDYQVLFPSRVPSFGYLWVNGYLLLTIAFRSLSRPSSVLGAQVSSLRSLQLNLILLKNFVLLHFALKIFPRHTYVQSRQTLFVK